jgi:uncharacterized protein YllA (UPF0747 family)
MSMKKQKSRQVRILNQRLVQILKLKMKDQKFSETKAIMSQYGYTQMIARTDGRAVLQSNNDASIILDPLRD